MTIIFEGKKIPEDFLNNYCFINCFASKKKTGEWGGRSVLDQLTALTVHVF